MEENRSLTGFLSVLEVENLGFCGGYLILNPHARPVEFHCSMPVAPTRTQQIMYGPTLRSCLFGETIGRALVEKTHANPQVVLTSSREAMSVQAFLPCPIAWVQQGPATDQLPAGQHPAIRSAGALELQSCFIKSHVLYSTPEHATRVEAIVSRLAEEFSIEEPFSRIQEAIREAHSVTCVQKDAMDPPAVTTDCSLTTEVATS